MKLNLIQKYTGLLLLAFILTGCNQDLPDKLYDPDADKGATPVLTALFPEDQTLAGVGEMTITGQNFSPVASENYVYFDGSQATVVSATPTELQIIAPDIVGDSLAVKVAVFRVELFSNSLIYKLIPAVLEFGTIEEPGADTQEAFAVAVDAAENIYVQTKAKKIKKIAPDGSSSDFSSTTYVTARSMKMGQGGLLYAAAAAGRVRKIVTYTAEGSESLFTTFSAAPEDFDFDAAGDLLVAVGSDIYRVKPDKSKTLIGSFPAKLKAVRLFNGLLYAMQIADGSGSQKIWTAKATETTLENITETFDSANAAWLAGADILTMAFAEDGTMLFGTDNVDNGMFRLNTDGSGAALYANLIAAEIRSLSWGNGTVFYALRHLEGATKVLRVDMGNLKSAPYEGRK